MKLTGWYRIGIVLSVLWFLWVIYITFYQYNYPNSYEYPLLVTLEPEKTKPLPPSGFTSDNPYMKTEKKIITTAELLKLDTRHVVLKPFIHYGNIFLYMVIPVVSGWVLTLTIIWTIKWVVRGFKNKEP